MIYKNLHNWNVSPSEARNIQSQLKDNIVISPLNKDVQFVGGADVSFDKGSNLVFAAIVILNLPDLSIVERKGVAEIVDFPYIPGLLAFREGPPMLYSWEKIKKKPDVMMFDAQGLAHPRRMGLATHIGLYLDISSIGCAKSVLVGQYQEPGEKAGEFTPLEDKGEIVGAAVRTKDRVNPVFVSIGHKVELSDAVNLVLQCSRGYRIPEPTRQAHLAVNKLRRGESIDYLSSSYQKTLF